MTSELTLGLGPVNERRRSIVTSLIGWTQTYNQPTHVYYGTLRPQQHNHFFGKKSSCELMFSPLNFNENRRSQSKIYQPMRVESIFEAL